MNYSEIYIRIERQDKCFLRVEVSPAPFEAWRGRIGIAFNKIDFDQGGTRKAPLPAEIMPNVSFSGTWIAEAIQCWATVFALAADIAQGKPLDTMSAEQQAIMREVEQFCSEKAG